MAIAPVVFTPGTMPRMYVMDVLSQQWVHRDVSGITQPVITWNLNAADTFTCTLSPPRADLKDSTGNPLFNEWQHACFLEQGGDILFGGILLSSQFNGPQWQMTWQGYAGYPSGMPYEGPDVSDTNKEALDVVRYIWDWLQSQPGGDLHLTIDRATDTGVLLGAQPSSVPAQSHLDGDINKGQRTIKVHASQAHDGYPAFAQHMTIQIGNYEKYKIREITDRVIGIYGRTTSHRKADTPVVQVVPPTPFTLDWYNSTDCGQEITSIQQEAIFDWTEKHYWEDAAKTTMHHAIRFEAPRRGSRRTECRFVEGENLSQTSQVTRDGTTFANKVIGLGAGQGTRMIRSEVSENNGRIRRVQVYQDQTVKNTARMTSKARRVLRSLTNINTPTSVVVRDHLNAPFGSFTIGDDILVTLNSGWQNISIWCRITAMAQDPTTDLITLTLVRSDSYTYMAQSGQAGTL